MYRRYDIPICLLLLLFGCKDAYRAADTEALKEEIVNTEHAFAAMAKSKGVAEAFQHYAADSAVLLRGKRLITGKEEMHAYFKSWTLEDISLDWEPVFVDVALSGDMGYTYGPYTFSARDSAGNAVRDTGYFHTVWKKRSDGEWRFVWD